MWATREQNSTAPAPFSPSLLDVGMDKWFPMMKNHFALDDDVLLLLVRTMKGQ